MGDFIPLNDVREKLRSSSYGSNKDLQSQSEGEEDTLDFRLHTTDTTGKKISLWHDISLVHIDAESKEDTNYLNFVCEIPKFTR
jgi:inorganic pyrophosphatase